MNEEGECDDRSQSLIPSERANAQQVPSTRIKSPFNAFILSETSPSDGEWLLLSQGTTLTTVWEQKCILKSYDFPFP